MHVTECTQSRHQHTCFLYCWPIDVFSRYSYYLGSLFLICFLLSGSDEVWIGLTYGNDKVYRYRGGDVFTLGNWDFDVGEPNYQNSDWCIRLYRRKNQYLARTTKCKGRQMSVCSYMGGYTISWFVRLSALCHGDIV